MIRRWQECAWLALVLALVLSLLGHGLLAQTHHHSDKRLAGTARTEYPAPASGQHHDPADRSGDCPICLELGHIGACLPPPLHALPMLRAVAPLVLLLAARRLVWKRWSLPARSRAPPLVLFA